MASNRVPLGRHLVKKVWSEEVGVMVYHHWSSKPFCASSQGTLVACCTTQHTAEPYWGPPIERMWRTQQEGGVRLGKDSTGVEASPNQDKLRRLNKYCRLRGLNCCPLAWELGTLPLDHLGFDSQLFCFVDTCLQKSLQVIKLHSLELFEERLGLTFQPNCQTERARPF